MRVRVTGAIHTYRPGCHRDETGSQSSKLRDRERSGLSVTGSLVGEGRLGFCTKASAEEGPFLCRYMRVDMFVYVPTS